MLGLYYNHVLNAIAALLQHLQILELATMHINNSL